jgi:hypothetical protein
MSAVGLESPPCQELPELQLWREVLFLAILDCRGESVAGTQYNKHDQQRAQAWMCSTREHPGSFLWCYEVLGVDPRAVHRRALKPFRVAL